jgi:hypothetical protein
MGKGMMPFCLFFVDNRCSHAQYELVAQLRFTWLVGAINFFLCVAAYFCAQQNAAS